MKWCLLAILLSGCATAIPSSFRSGLLAENATVEWFWWVAPQRCDVRVLVDGNQFQWIRGVSPAFCGVHP